MVCWIRWPYQQATGRPGEGKGKPSKWHRYDSTRPYMTACSLEVPVMLPEVSTEPMPPGPICGRCASMKEFDVEQTTDAG